MGEPCGVLWPVCWAAGLPAQPFDCSNGLREHYCTGPPCRSRALAWSSSLASSAQAWADGCVFAHSSSSDGENIVSGWLHSAQCSAVLCRAGHGRAGLGAGQGRAGLTREAERSLGRTWDTLARLVPSPAACSTPASGPPIHSRAWTHAQGAQTPGTTRST